MRNSPLSRSLGLSGLAACLLIPACARPEPVVEADPAEVARFLAELEAQQQERRDVLLAEARAEEEEERKSGSSDRLVDLVESASKRSLSPATLNQVEETVVESLAG